MSGPVVYVIQARNGAIKIGFSAEPHKRLAAIRTHSPLPVRLIAILGPGTHREERALHDRFDHCRSHAEWFVGPDIGAFSLEIMGRGLSLIENWADIEFLGMQGRQERRKRLIRAHWEDPEYRLSVMRSQLDCRVWREFHPMLKDHPYEHVRALASAEGRRRRPDLFPTPAPQVAA